MIISKDSRILLIGVPKTGTRSLENILLRNGIRLKVHKNYAANIIEAKNKIENFDESEIEKVYIFWRDPIERFIGAANFIRDPKIIQFTLRYRPQWFNGINIPPPNGPLPPMEEVPPLFHDVFKTKIGREVNRACINRLRKITPEQIFNDKELMERCIFFMRQSLWYEGIPANKKVVLDFSNFDYGFDILTQEFGLGIIEKIPKLNQSNKLDQRLSPELEAAAREYYAGDYAFKP